MTALLYTVDGPEDGPVLLLGGSLGTTVRMWDPMVAAMAGAWRVVRFNHRGHGGSPAPAGPYRLDDLGTDVLELLDHLELSRVHFAGLSLGGMVGMWLAAHVPDRIDRLVLMCTAAHLPPAQGWLDRAAAVRAGGMAVVADTVVARWFTPAFADAPAYRAMLLGIAPEGYAGCCEAIAAMDLRPMLPSIEAPTLVIAGAEDPATPPALGEEIALAVPDGRLEVVERASHLASVERPDAVADLLLRHLGEATDGQRVIDEQRDHR